MSWRRTLASYPLELASANGPVDTQTAIEKEPKIEVNILCNYCLNVYYTNRVQNTLFLQNPKVSIMGHGCFQPFCFCKPESVTCCVTDCVQGLT